MSNSVIRQGPNISYNLCTFIAKCRFKYKVRQLKKETTSLQLQEYPHLPFTGASYLTLSSYGWSTFKKQKNRAIIAFKAVHFTDTICALLNTAGVRFGPNSATHVLVPFVWLNPIIAVQVHSRNGLGSVGRPWQPRYSANRQSFCQVINAQYGLFLVDQSAKTLTEIWKTVACRNDIKNVHRFQYIDAAHVQWIKTKAGLQ
jgi:hypothetical protein